MSPMNPSKDDTGQPLVACDACCGRLARWLRLLGVDTTYIEGIDDGELVALALAQGRVVVSSDNGLFLRRVFTRGELRGVHLPVGISVDEQLEIVIPALSITPAPPRCTICNGSLARVGRAEVADRVPARTLVWLAEYYVCADCGHVFWEGTHWRRIGKLRERFWR